MAENNVNNTEVQEDDETIILADEEGKEVRFRHVATLDYEEEWYMYLEPLEEKAEDSEDAELVIFHIETDADGNDVFVPVEDEEMLDKLFDEFMKAAQAQED